MYYCVIPNMGGFFIFYHAILAMMLLGNARTISLRTSSAIKMPRAQGTGYSQYLIGTDRVSIRFWIPGTSVTRTATRNEASMPAKSQRLRRLGRIGSACRIDRRRLRTERMLPHWTMTWERKKKRRKIKGCKKMSVSFAFGTKSQVRRTKKRVEGRKTLPG